MIGIVLQRANEVVKVVVDGHNVYFQTEINSNRMYPIDALKLEYSGVVKEFPDLKDAPNWQEQAIARFKEKMKGMQSEEERCLYIQYDLAKFGYEALYRQRAGFRPEKIR